MRNKNARFSIYALAGIYLLYIVKKLAENLSTAGSERWLMIIFIALFSLIGTTMIITGIRQVLKSRKSKKV